ncbi:GNAT family N-acetyltransferase [Legionella fallonii]|uniref:Gcn5-related N-acetyltransferase n=1 Tax=Legionella fallonii LLAP-10 TaxID=1212491 RepID=A0A098G7B4_9GAMM|nr:GNAT family N-acetyltransferase [Legionella fallonii]CEG58353.1 Gcn5-related N-acetyltransferase [Legionella fallonii LLAP-10]
MMIRLEKNSYEQIYRLYLRSKFFFPLIASVLLDEQDGVVYVNKLNAPSQVYVEHAFGFAQIFGNVDMHFEQELEQYLLFDKNFSADKVRLYAPYTPEFIIKAQYEPLKSYRQRFVLGSEYPIDKSKILDQADKKISFSEVNQTNISIIESQFGLVSRFWRNGTDFIQKSNAVVILYEGEVASICYAAAQANNCSEIDVFTLPNYRSLGLANKVVLYFITHCFELGLTPLWDCFTNNLGSMMLCKSVGFNALNTPYPFFTINK